MRQHVGHRRQDRESAGPARRAVLDPETRGLSQYQVLTPGLAQSDHRLGNHQPQVLLKPLGQFASAVRDGLLLLTGSGSSQTPPSRTLCSEGGDIVGEQIEGAAAREVELGVVPVTGQDPVGHGPLAQREAHVRATIIDRENLLTVPEHGRRALTGRDNTHAARAAVPQASTLVQWRSWRFLPVLT